MIIASVHTAPRSVLELGSDVPATEDDALAQLCRTLEALEADLCPLRCSLRLGELGTPPDGAQASAVSGNTRRVLVSEAAAATLAQSSGVETTVHPTLSAQVVIGAARELISSANQRNAGGVILAGFEVDAMLLRAPAEVLADADVTLETWSGPRWTSVRSSASVFGFQGPSADGKVPSPGVLYIERAETLVSLSLLINWSLWSEPNAPAWSVIESIATRLRQAGWEGG